jgi:hypothetical protein
MEPIIIVILGTVIGGIVVSMYLPIFKLGADRLACRTSSLFCRCDLLLSPWALALLGLAGGQLPQRRRPPPAPDAGAAVVG